MAAPLEFSYGKWVTTFQPLSFLYFHPIYYSLYFYIFYLSSLSNESMASDWVNSSPSSPPLDAEKGACKVNKMEMKWNHIMQETDSLQKAQTTPSHIPLP